jgi:sec-independent protein translocase protein TatC
MNEQETPESADTPSKVMGLMDHLGELRSRLVKSCIGLLVIFSLAMAYSTPILEYLKMPLRKAMPDAANLLHFTSPLEPFIAQLKVSFLTAFIFGSPIWIYQFWRFVEPALYAKEKKYVMPFAFASVCLFFIGVSFCFYIMLPMALHFLISLGMESANAIITISDYISMIMVLIFAFGIIFETPLILILLALLDIITADGLAKNRRFVLVGILVAGALLTPPDPISQMAMALPTYIMFEMAIIIIRIIKKKAPE